MTTSSTTNHTFERPDVKIVTVTGSESPVSIQYSAGQVFNLVDSVTKGESVKNWRENIRHCLSATTYLDGVRKVYYFPNSRAYRDDVVTTGSKKGKIRRRTLIGAIEGSGSIPTVSSELLSETTLAARATFLKRSIAAQQKIQSLVALGEIGQTARMIKGLASGLHHGVWNYLGALVKRRKRSKPKKKTSEIISETWLEYSFGWQPLLNDIDGAAHALAESRVNASRKFERINAYARRGTSSQAVFVDREYPGGTPQFIVHRRSLQAKACSVRFSGAVNLQPPGTNAVTNQFGLRLRDIVPSLWELVPYSFLVDYFTNIGDMISACAFQRSDLRWVEYGWKHESVNTAIVDSVEFPALVGHSLNNSYYQASGEQRLTSTTVHREQDFGSFIPPFQFEIPGLSSKKWLNIAALVGASRRTSKQLSAY